MQVAKAAQRTDGDAGSQAQGCDRCGSAGRRQSDIQVGANRWRCGKCWRAPLFNRWRQAGLR